MQNTNHRATITADAVPFGRSRSEVIERLGEPGYSRPGLMSDGFTDCYEGFKIEYDQALNCAAVEFSRTLILGGIDLLSLTWAELTHWFLARDPSLQPGEILESHHLKMIATSKPPEHLKPEAIALLSEDYRWPTEADFEAALAHLEANAPSVAELAKKLGLEDYF